jgi:hypothetical protein
LVYFEKPRIDKYSLHLFRGPLDYFEEIWLIYDHLV